METKKNTADAWDALLDTLVERLAAAVQPAPATAELLTAKELAALLKVPQRWVYEQSRAGNIPTRRLGKKYIRFDPKAVLASFPSNKN